MQRFRPGCHSKDEGREENYAVAFIAGLLFLRMEAIFRRNRERVL